MKNLDKMFKLTERKTNVRTEIIAGATTFLAMAYILAVNPYFLSQANMDYGAVFTATALASAIATLVMAFVANLPFALAPGMGLNAFFAFVVCGAMGHTWQFALTAILVEGIIFIILTFANVREAIVNSIPKNLKNAISVGIGLFIAFIGMKNGGVIVSNPDTFVALGDVTSGMALVTVIGLVITAVLMAYKVKGALLFGIILTTLVAALGGLAPYNPIGLTYAPQSLAPTFFKFEFTEVFTLDFLIVVFTFLFVDMFDTVGTLIGCATKAKMIQEDGSIPNCKEALLADSIGTTVGAILGTSTVTTYVESSAGVSEGGRTGLTALTVAVLFLISLFLAPLFSSIPNCGTAPALILVGFMMITPIKDIDFEDPTEGIPAFLCLITMVLSYSISDGIMFGIVSWVLLKLFSNKVKEIKLVTWIIAVLFLIKFIVG